MKLQQKNLDWREAPSLSRTSVMSYWYGVNSLKKRFLFHCYVIWSIYEITFRKRLKCVLWLYCFL